MWVAKISFRSSSVDCCNNCLKLFWAAITLSASSLLATPGNEFRSKISYSALISGIFLKYSIIVLFPCALVVIVNKNKVNKNAVVLIVVFLRVAFFFVCVFSGHFALPIP
jgi:hypothetical protein